MRVSAKKIAAVVILSGVLLLVWAGAALAGPPWSDAPDSWWQSSYGVGETEVATVADGFLDGTFKPSNAVTRGQFAKMAVSGLGVTPANPATPTFKDVGRGGTFYVYVEGAYAADLIGGYSTSTGLYFRPNNNITRQQANTILGRYLSDFEIKTTGAIHGTMFSYGTLELWYQAEGGFYLNGFEDADKVSSQHRATTAYLKFRGIVQGSSGRLNPTATLIRAQAAALVLRVKAEAADIATPPPAPTNLAVVASGPGVAVISTGTAQYAGNDATPQVTGDTLSSRDIAIYDTPFYGSAYIKLDSANASGKFYADLNDPMKPLADGTHSFTAKVKNANGLVSPASEAVTYVLDTVLPTGSLTAPVLLTGKQYAAVGSAKPLFTATATDDRAGVKEVRFQVSPDQTTLDWQTISTDTAPDTGTNLYAAVWPASGSFAAGLADGHYQFRAVVTDVAGNERVLGPMNVTVDSVAPTVNITAPVPASGTVFYTEDTAPAFTADAADTGSGIARVDFLYVAWNSPGPTAWTAFTLLSSDDAASYAAVYPTGGLPEGHYIFAARATDFAGNQSVLMDGAIYKSGVTQEVVIDGTAPVVTVTSPSAGQPVMENSPFAIKWTLTDVTPPNTVKIDYTLDGSVPSPVWVEIDASTPNDGSYDWATPAVTGDNANFRIRITAIDKAGAEVGDLAGHTTAALSGLFTVFDLPEAVTNLAVLDPDVTTGVDGRDFSATWSVSVSPDIVGQRVYILRDGVGLNLTTDHPVATISGNVSNSWSGDASLTRDSQGTTGVLLAAGSYRIYIVVVDTSAHIALATSGAFTVADP
jgi:hypothetical protein